MSKLRYCYLRSFPKGMHPRSHKFPDFGGLTREPHLRDLPCQGLGVPRTKTPRCQGQGPSYQEPRTRLPRLWASYRVSISLVFKGKIDLIQIKFFNKYTSASVSTPNNCPVEPGYVILVGWSVVCLDQLVRPKSGSDRTYDGLGRTDQG